MKSTQTDRGFQEVDDAPTACPLCGRVARYRGRRERVLIFECVDDRCIAGIFEVCNGAPVKRGATSS